ncbi:MAG: ribonuclease H-like domain-containing protein [Vicinamibacterales bacterium]
MSTLSDRLRGIVGGAIPRVSADVGAAPAPVTPGVRLAESALREAASTLGGRLSPHAFGATVVVERRYEAAERYGRTTIGDIAGVIRDGREALAVLTRAWPTRHGEAGSPVVSAADLWFLDLETTGLAGGAGTQAFLVGCAHLDGDGVQVTQFLLPGFEHERAVLAEVAGWAADRARSCRSTASRSTCRSSRPGTCSTGWPSRSRARHMSTCCTPHGACGGARRPRRQPRHELLTGNPRADARRGAAGG